MNTFENWLIAKPKRVEFIMC